jgi:hypothetical protein
MSVPAISLFEHASQIFQSELESFVYFENTVVRIVGSKLMNCQGEFGDGLRQKCRKHKFVPIQLILFSLI